MIFFNIYLTCCVFEGDILLQRGLRHLLERAGAGAEQRAQVPGQARRGCLRGGYRERDWPPSHAKNHIYPQCSGAGGAEIIRNLEPEPQLSF